MFILKGTIKDDKNKSFVRKDGTHGVVRSLFIDPVNSVYPIKVNVPMDKDYGQIGSPIEIEVDIFPYCYVDKMRQKAYVSIYVPEAANSKE
jgi:hypothetical protein